MDKWIDKPEKEVRESKYDEDLYRNFRRSSDESVSDDKVSEGHPNESLMERRRQSAYGNKWQGDIGEGITIRAASERLGLTPDPSFDQPPRGIDGIYRDSKGNMVLVESKLAEKGINSLEGDQMQVEWVARKAKLMQSPGNEQYTIGNSELGAEILRTGPNSIRRLVVLTDPRTLEAKVYEGQSDRSWKPIDSFSVYDLEQPNLI